MLAKGTPPSSRYKWGKRLFLSGLLLAAYPVFVFGAVYAHWFSADLPGGRNGPADAYRHSLASAIVAYTGSPFWVRCATWIMEDDGRGNDMRAMDAHNNRIGAAIGARARSWSEMQGAVLAAVSAGTVHAENPDQITWLPRERWQNRLY
jgi:hypothetical protein